MEEKLYMYQDLICFVPAILPQSAEAVSVVPPRKQTLNLFGEVCNRTNTAKAQ